MEALTWMIGIVTLLCGAAFGSGACWLHWTKTSPDTYADQIDQDLSVSRKILRGVAYVIVLCYLIIPCYMMLSKQGTSYSFVYSLGVWLGNELTRWIFNSPNVYNAEEDLTVVLTDDPTPEPNRSMQTQTA